MPRVRQTVVFDEDIVVARPYGVVDCLVLMAERNPRPMASITDWGMLEARARWRRDDALKGALVAARCALEQSDAFPVCATSEAAHPRNPMNESSGGVTLVQRFLSGQAQDFKRIV